MRGAASSSTPSPPRPSRRRPTPTPEANLPFLFAVYILTWAGFFGYAFYMSRRQRDMRREIDALKQVLLDRQEQDVTSSKEESR